MGSKSVLQTLHLLIRYLQKRGLNIIVESDTASFIEDDCLQVCSRKNLGEACDLVIVVGGDGCLLGAARALAKPGTPVFGVNRGRLGFLTDASPSEVEQRMDEVFAGNYTIESRFLLDVQIERAGQSIAFGDALNDVVLHPGQAVQMLEFELYIEGAFVYSQRSDGLIVSTPTGSTAYSLSAGGPIMHPSLDAVVLVPMFAHTLNSRPIVVHGSSEIKIVLGSDRDVIPHVSCDGQSSIQAQPDDVLYIRKKPHKLNLVHTLDNNFYATCRDKLGWGSKLTE
ncbi:MAG: NAD(+) kinase [Pseudomonadales bacterium]|nr:NAD(+) kinase [Pseudomonadales bacterium]